jgi:GPN-loop GTPase
LVFDCPGQIELYNHVDVFNSLVAFLKNDGWAVCVVYCLDCHFITDASKFIAGCMQVRLEAARVYRKHTIS